MGGYHFNEMIKGVPKRIRIPTLGCASLQRHEQKCHCGNRRSAASGGCSKAISRMCPDFHDTKWLKIVWHDGVDRSAAGLWRSVLPLRPVSYTHLDVYKRQELGLALEPEETGTTFTENARIKAEAVMQASGLPAIADDSGLCVDALNGAPGVYSARYGGLDDDVARYRLLLENLRGAGTRAAHFHTSVVCCFPNGDVLEAEGDCHGTIAYAPQGENGFGYDPVFFVPEMRKIIWVIVQI